MSIIIFWKLDVLIVYDNLYCIQCCFFQVSYQVALKFDRVWGSKSDMILLIYWQVFCSFCPGNCMIKMSSFQT